MAFPVYGSHATKEESPDADGSITVSIPSHNAGDQLLLLSGHGRTSSSGTSGIVNSEPSGWTQLLLNKAESSGRRLLSLWTKTGDGSESSVSIGYSETGKKSSARCQVFENAGTIIAGTAKTSSGTSHDINTITGLTDGDYLGMWIGLGWSQPNNFSTQDNYLKTGISGGGQSSISAYTFATEFSGTQWNPSGFSTNFNRPYVLIGLAIPGAAASSSIIPLIQDEI